MKTTTLLSIIVCLLMLISCSDLLFPDENLTIKRSDYTGNELRIDGYYHLFNEKNNITVVYYFYRNGVILLGGSFSGNDLNEIEKKLVNTQAKSKTNWGVFLIENNTIKYEKWIGSSSSTPKAYLFSSKGYILNDTTIHLIEEYYSERKETRAINEIWRFKQFNNKPDSTNVYIK